MKQIHKIYMLFFILISISVAGYSQTPDSLGLPGDDLNLYGVLSLFKDSKDVQDFEQKLNTPDNKVNNLDLNHDGQIDYIRVRDYGQNGIHSLVLQDPITATESQDLAIVEIEQQGNDNAHIQIVGDEDLYGKNYIIEPQDQQQTEQAQPASNDTYGQGTPAPTVVVNVWAWPSVQYMYGPSYTYWNSPWYWGYYPTWWSPWRPMGYHTYWMGMYPYRAYHRRVYENRIVVAQNVYYGHRQTSTIVHKNIENHVYYGPREKAAGQPIRNNNAGGPRSGKVAQTNPKLGGEPRQQVGGKAPIRNISQPKTQPMPRQQQYTPKPTQAQAAPRQEMPKQQQAPRQEMPRQQQAPRQEMPKQQQAPRQEMPRQQQAPRQQAAPHNMGGGGGHPSGGGGGRKKVITNYTLLKNDSKMKITKLKFID